MRVDSTDGLRSVLKPEMMEAVPRAAAANSGKSDIPQSDIVKTKETREIKENKQLEEAIEKFNKAVAGYDRECQISVHEKTNSIMVKIIDINTQEIVREIPPEKILDLVAKMCELAGIIIDERR